MIRALRDEALLIVEGRGAILDVAREVTHVPDQTGAPGMIVGGVAVVLHGHVRTTGDVAVYVGVGASGAADALRAAGFTFDAARREFALRGVPVHLVISKQVKTPPVASVEIEGVRMVDLASLVTMKLEAGLSSPLRAQDIADVIGLIRHHQFTPAFASHLPKPVRPEFRKLVRAVGRERGD